MIHRLTIDTFAANADGAALLAHLAHDQALAHCRLQHQDGGMAAALARYAQATTPDVIVVQWADGADGLLAALDMLAERCDARSHVVVVGAHNDIALYRALLGRGVSDYLPLPVVPADLTAAILRPFADPATAARGTVVACWGVRGGSGASTLAQNLAFCLAGHVCRPVVYADLDMAFGTSGLAFDLEARQTSADMLAHPDRMDQMMLDRSLLDYGPYLRVLAAPGDPRTPVRPDSDGVDRLLDLTAAAGRMVVVDLPHLWSDWTAHVLYRADRVVLVSAPDLASLRDCRTMLDILAANRGDKAAPLLVLNRVDSAKTPQLGAGVFAQTLGVTPDQVIGQDVQGFGDAANGGRLLVETAPASKAAQAFATLAQRLTGMTAPPHQGWRQRLTAWMKG